MENPKTSEAYAQKKETILLILRSLENKWVRAERLYSAISENPVEEPFLDTLLALFLSIHEETEIDRFDEGRAKIGRLKSQELEERIREMEKVSQLFLET